MLNTAEQKLVSRLKAEHSTAKAAKTPPSVSDLLAKDHFGIVDSIEESATGCVIFFIGKDLPLMKIPKNRIKTSPTPGGSVTAMKPGDLIRWWGAGEYIDFVRARELIVSDVSR